MLNHYREGEVVEEITTVGIDLAKNVFSVHAVGSQGEVVVRRTLSRAKLSELIAQLPPCLIGMEACSGAHEWARRFAASGHTVKLMAAKFVMPYRKSGKNDGNDRSEEHTSELQSRLHLVCRLLLEKKKKTAL